jgi:hypothetical protein
MQENFKGAVTRPLNMSLPAAMLDSTSSRDSRQLPPASHCSMLLLQLLLPPM